VFVLSDQPCVQEELSDSAEEKVVLMLTSFDNDIDYD